MTAKKKTSPSRKTRNEDESSEPECDLCKHFACSAAKDCFGKGNETAARLKSDEETLLLARAAAEVEALFYGRATRVEEILRFAERIGASRIGVAFCTGLKEEARIFCDLMRRRFKVSSVCCKNGAVAKESFGFPHVHPVRRESMCNPLGQAQLLNEAGTDLNVAIGLCVGHDSVFFRNSKAPVTVLVAKDRVLAHNPAGALTCPYTLKRLKEGPFA